MNARLKNFFEHKSLPILLLSLVSFGIYVKSLFYDFSPLDEQWLILNESREVLKEWKSIVTGFGQSISNIYYRPLLMATFVIDFHTGQLHPFAYHLSNVILHTLAVLLLYKLLRELKTQRTNAFVFALLFSVHPVLLHAVAWIPGRNDTLLAVFTLLALIFLVRYINTNKVPGLLLHLLFFTCALLTKESAVMLPLVFVLFYQINKPYNKVFFSLLLPWLLLPVVWYLVKSQLVNFVPEHNGNLAESLKRFLMGLLVFIGKTILPVQQSLAPTPRNTSPIPGFVALAILTLLYFKIGLNNKKTALAGVLMFLLLLLLPVWFGAVNPIGEQYEHRAYTPMIGMFVFFSQLKLNLYSRTVLLPLLCVILLFAARTSTRMGVYRSKTSYLSEALRDCPENYLLQVQQGNLLFGHKQYLAAIPFYSESIRLRPARFEAYHNRGNAFIMANKKNEALNDYNKAMELSGNHPSVRISRCEAFAKFGDYESAMNDLQVLWQCCRSMVKPDFATNLTRKWLLLRIDTVNKLIAKNPTSGILYVNRAKYYVDLKKAKEALADLNRAIELEPDNVDFKHYYDELVSSMEE